MNVHQIKEEIDRLFSDTSVPVSETRGNLKDLAEHIVVLLESLPEGDD